MQSSPLSKHSVTWERKTSEKPEQTGDAVTTRQTHVQNGNAICRRRDTEQEKRPAAQTLRSYHGRMKINHHIINRFFKYSGKCLESIELLKFFKTFKICALTICNYLPAGWSYRAVTADSTVYSSR